MPLLFENLDLCLFRCVPIDTMAKPKVYAFSTAYHPFVGGAEIAIEEVSRRLKDRFDFTIVTARMRRDIPKRELRPEGTVIRLGFGTRFDKWLLPVLVLFRISDFGFRISAKQKNVLLWGMDLSQGSLAALAFKFFHPRTPLVFTLQYGENEERIRRGRGGFIRRALCAILFHADAVTAISSYLLALSGEYRYRGIARLIPNGVDGEKFKIQNSKVRSSRKNQKIVITTSRLVKKNGIDVLIRAMKEVKKSISGAECWILGDGPERGALEKLSLSLGLGESVQLLGSIPHEEVPNYLCKADVFVRPSRSEGMGNSFVESLSCGVPIIGTPVGGIPDIIEDGVTGLFARPEDPGDLAQKILRLLRDRKLQNRIAVRGQDMVRDRFSWDRIADIYSDLFRELLAAKKRILVATGAFPPDIGGPATYTKTLLEHLPRRGIMVRVSSFGDYRRYKKGIRHFLFFLDVVFRGRFADVVFAQDPVSVGLPAFFAAWCIRREFALKVVGDYAWEQGIQRFGVTDLLNSFLGKRYSVRVEILRKIETFVARRARLVIVPSAYLRSVILWWGVQKEKVVVIENAAESSKRISRESARVFLGVEGALLVSSGRLVPWKGFSLLIDAMSDILRRASGAELVILGSGPLEEILKERAKKNNVSHRVRFLGRVSPEDHALYLAAADVFILNTAYEGFSHTILEALSRGTPVVTTAVGGNPELIRDGENGLLVPYDNRNELVRAVFRVLDDPAFGARLGAEGRKTSMRFTAERMADKTVTLFT